MKNKLLVLLGMCLFSISNYAQHDTVKISVKGNCGMCENRIEKAARIKGVNYADWDMETSILSLVYDNTVSLQSIEESIANVGHETQNVKANVKAYNKLPDCCLYMEETEGKVHILLKGKVFEATDNTKIPLFGANVYWLETTEGITTNFDGEFAIERHPGENTLVISYVGLDADTIRITNESIIEAVKSKNAKLKDFVVTSRVSPTSISSFNAIKIEKMSTKELAKAPCCNLSESFETNPSVDVAYNDAITGTKQIQMLGLSGPSIQINSGNLPDVRGLAAIQGLTFIPGPWIQNIYLNKGTGSVVNGYESIAGQMDVELRENQDKLVVNGYLNQMGRMEGNLSIHTKVKEYVSTTTHGHISGMNTRNDVNKDGFLDNPLNANGYIHNGWEIIGKKGFTYHFGGEGILQNRIGGQNNFTKNTPKDSSVWGYKGTTKRVKAYAKIGKVYDEYPGKSMGLQLLGSYFEDDNRFGFNNYFGTQSNLYVNYIFQNTIGENGNLYKLGISYNQDEYKENINNALYERVEYVSGIFGELTIASINRLTVVSGLRADYHSMFGGFLTPRLHLKYDVAEKSALRFSVGRGQRTTNIFAENMGAFASSRTITIQGDSTNPNLAYGLSPEIAWTIGGSYTQGITIHNREATFSVDVYRTNFTNQIVVDWENPREIVFYNLNGQSFSNSIQAQVDIEILSSLDMRMAYRYYDVRVDYQSKGLLNKPYVANNRAFVNLAYEIKETWMFDATLNWIGKQRLPSTKSNPESFIREDYAPSFVKLAGQVTKKWNTFSLYAGVENALNFKQNNPILDAENPYSSTFDSSMIWGPIFGRNIYIGFRYII